MAAESDSAPSTTGSRRWFSTIRSRPTRSSSSCHQAISTSWSRGSVTGVAPSATLDFRGRTIALEATEEILAKKLFHRAAFLKPRDVFDLVVTSKMLPGAAQAAIEAAASRRGLQLARLQELK